MVDRIGGVVPDEADPSTGDVDGSDSSVTTPTPRLPHPATGEPYPSPVPPGTGWPGDPADAGHPGRHHAPRRYAASRAATDLDELDARVSVCRACPRLVALARGRRARQAGVVRRRALLGPADPGLGLDRRRGCSIVGLAPAANGANRTGRVFTGDRSGDWLFASLHRVGLARTATSAHAADGQELIDTRMVATVRCAPPQNKPTVAERDTCAPWIEAELGAARRPRAGRGRARWVRLGRHAALVRRRSAGQVAAPEAPVRPRRRGTCWSTATARSRCSAATTRASRTPSPAGSPSRCSTIVLGRAAAAARMPD